MLSPYRVLDLTDHRGELGAMILGDLGADVIRIEPPGGSAARQQPPFLADDVDPAERSLSFASFNRNKRSIVLNVSAEQDLLQALVASADFVFESWPPGELDRHGVGFATLRQWNPRVVHVRVSPFGCDGPAALRPANDLTLSALGGQAAIQGSPDRAPIRVSVPQLWRHAGAQAAAAALIAHARQVATGTAQFVDVSAQCASTWTTLNAMDAHAIQGYDFERMGSTVQMGTAAIDPVFECADGHLVALPTGSVLSALLPRVLEEGLAGREFLDEDWTTFDGRARAGMETAISREQVAQVLVEFFKRHTKQDLFGWGLAAGATIAPVNTTADLLAFDQLDVRGAWTDMELANGKRARGAGIFAKMSKTPAAVRAAAPRLDEHGEEIRAELTAASTPTPSAAVPQAASDRPFDGLKVLDLTWIIAGPASVRYLADHGATVIKVESELRPDGLRGLGPMRGEPGWNKSQFYGEFNAGKKCMQLNLKEPAGLALLKRLIEWADVLVENWAPGATERLGIHYEANRKLNENLIMLSTSLFGQTGPAAELGGFGYHAGGMAGFYEVTGWPDLPPHGPWLAYTDCIAPHFIAALIAGALDHRRRTGEGQHIDASQFEMSLQFLAPEILEYQHSGHLATRLGNRNQFAAPQGIYRCAGDDQWCAVAVDTDAQWQALTKAIGASDWSADESLATHAGRLAAHDAIDQRLEAWCASRDRYDVMATLTTAGVPAGAVQRSSDLAVDAQYDHRGFHRFLDHAEMGRIPYAGAQFLIPGYEMGPYTAAPLLGEHSMEVLEEVLELTPDEIADAFAANAIQ